MTSLTDAIDHDLPCISCGYNLRGLPPGGRCPECGHAIVQSMAAGEQWRESVPNLRRLARGLAFIVLSVLVICTIFVSFVANLNTVIPETYLWPIVLTVAHVLGAVAWWYCADGFLVGMLWSSRWAKAGRSVIRCIAVVYVLLFLLIAPELLQTGQNELLQQYGVLASHFFAIVANLLLLILLWPTAILTGAVVRWSFRALLIPVLLLEGWSIWLALRGWLHSGLLPLTTRAGSAGWELLPVSIYTWLHGRTWTWSPSLEVCVVVVLSLWLIALGAMSASIYRWCRRREFVVTPRSFSPAG